jgi:hypothetical protein
VRDRLQCGLEIVQLAAYAAANLFAQLEYGGGSYTRWLLANWCGPL